MLPASAAQAEPAMRPGQWEYSVKTQMAGMPVPLPAMTEQRCLTQADIDEGMAMRNTGPNKECEIRNLEESGNRISYDFVCATDPPVDGHYDFVVTETTMQGSGTMDAGGQRMTMTFDATRLGDCKTD